jgi:adenylosuccinate synthase
MGPSSKFRNFAANNADMKIDVLLGLQWGDEGKGKIVDYLADRYRLVARFQGGPNAGHTLVIGGQKFVLHTVPSGIFRQELDNLIGNGVVVDPLTLRRELESLDRTGIPYRDRLFVAHKAHLILPTHRWLDAASEAAKGKEKIGSTLRGIGPTYMDKTGRNGLRAGDMFSPQFGELYRQLREKHLKLLRIYTDLPAFDLEAEEARWFEAVDFIRQLQFVDGEYFVHDVLSRGHRILAEGAQGSMLDVDFGTYPYVTSSNTITAGVCNGLGVAPQRIGEVIGITKAYCTRVGGGPFPTELHDEVGQQLRDAGHEYGSTTGRPRRCGWIDLPQLRYASMLNGVTQVVVTKIDVLDDFPEILVGRAYRIGGRETDRFPYDLCRVQVEPVFEAHPGWQAPLTGVRRRSDLPGPAVAFLEMLQQRLHVPVSMVSVGPDREQLIPF